ncbi:MAG: cupin domain-containing protein [Gemmatimonadota bacterium]|jgi:quercetin dioxygenase-like cupin family protein
MHFVRKAADASTEPVGAGSDTWRQVLIGSDEGPNFQLRRFRIEPGGGMPMHTNSVEHEQYVLGGRAVVRIGGDRFEVGRDDVVLIPAGVPHSYETIGKDPFEFLCVVPNGPDRIEIVGD